MNGMEGSTVVVTVRDYALKNFCKSNVCQQIALCIMDHTYCLFCCYYVPHTCLGA
ncbi:hypothetical protein AHF37_10259 [Paragonimus kellicotti]|nr:hypothetical protein AHF37_10259 [Paragonimus kellicotti]